MEPSQRDSSSDYRAAFYERYHTALGIKPEPPDAAHLDRLVEHFAGRWNAWLPADRSLPCLDLGCGTGEFLYYLRAQGFPDVSGVDLNEEELAIARAIGISDVRHGSAIDYLKATKSASLGLVTALNFFEHLTKLEVMDMLVEIARVLRPGGTLLAVTPNGLSPFGGTTRYWDFTHETGFTPASWRQLSRMNGFASVDFEDYGPLSTTWRGRVRTVLWSAIRAGLTAISYIEVGGPRDASRVFTADMKIILRR